MPPTAPRPPRRWRRILLRVVEVGTITVAFGALLLWCSIPNTAPLETENPTTTAFIDLRRAQAEAAGKSFKLAWEWRPIGKISRYLRASVVYAEDYRFYHHDGVDWDAVERALDANLDKGALAIGGSTITQQLAKNLYLSPNRSFTRKLREMLIAFSLEDHLSKTRILELYLNVVEWGDGVFGAEAASRKWFGHSAQSLTPAEAARLAIALPNPITRAPNVHTPELTKKAVRIVRLLRLQGLIDPGQERTALDGVGAPSSAVLPSKYVPGDPIPSLARDDEPEPAPPPSVGSGSATSPTGSASEPAPPMGSGTAEPSPPTGSATEPTGSGAAPPPPPPPAPAAPEGPVTSPTP
jgi:monofunctional biosynthetic peptidoglycan transglycosylase